MCMCVNVCLSAGVHASLCEFTLACCMLVCAFALMCT